MNKSIIKIFKDEVILNEKLWFLINSYLSETEVLKLLDIINPNDYEKKIMINTILLKYYCTTKIQTFEKNKIFKKLFSKSIYKINIKDINDSINESSTELVMDKTKIDNIFINKFNIGYLFVTFYNKIEKKLYYISKEKYNNENKNIYKSFKCINNVTSYNSNYYIFYTKFEGIYAIINDNNVEKEIKLNLNMRIKNFWLNYNLLFMQDFEDNIYFLICKKLNEIDIIANQFDSVKNIFKIPVDYVVKDITVSKSHILLLSISGKILYYSYKFNNDEFSFNKILFVELQKYRFHKVYTTGINSYIAVIKNEKYDVVNVTKESFISFLKEYNLIKDIKYLNYIDFDIERILSKDDDYIIEIMNFKTDKELGIFKVNLNLFINGFKNHHKCLIWGFNNQNLGIWTGKKNIKTPELFVLDTIEKLNYIKSVKLNHNYGFFLLNSKEILYSFISKAKKNKKNKKSNLINITQTIEKYLNKEQQKIKDIRLQNDSWYILTENSYKSKSFNKSFLGPNQIFNKIKENPKYDVRNFIFGLKKNPIELNYDTFIESEFCTDDIYYIKEKKSNIIIYDRLLRKNILENF